MYVYLHDTLQYKIRNDLQLGNNPETINSVFVEVDKSDFTLHYFGCDSKRE